MTDHEKRIRDFLSERAAMRGLCPEQISGANGVALNVPDLLALLADLDEKTKALKYARRFLNAKDHDVAFVDAALKGAAHE